MKMRGHVGSMAVRALLLAGCGMGSALAEQTPVSLESRSLVVDGIERSYELYRPADLPAEADTVVVLHGSGGNAERIRGFTGRRFEALADEHGFRVLYPNGFETNWNGCRAASPTSANQQGIDDVAFLRRMLDREASQGRRFLFGFSGGGHMAFRMALEAPQSISAIAVAAASLPTADGTDCESAETARPPAVMMVNGTHDPINPYQGGPVVLPEALGGATLGSVRSSEETARFFAQRAGHDADPVVSNGPEQDGDAQTRTVLFRWGSEASSPVLLATIVGGGHTIPGAEVAFPKLAGRHTGDLDALTEAWTFMTTMSPNE